MHLAVSTDGRTYTPLRNNTGILFAKASYIKDAFVGVTKTLTDPWVFRGADGSFKVCAVWRNQNAPDPEHLGCMAVYSSKDMVHYSAPVFVQLSAREICRPRCAYEAEKQSYYIEWDSEDESFCGYSRDLQTLDERAHLKKSKLSADVPENLDIEGCVPGNVIPISTEEERVIRGYLGEIRFDSVKPAELTVPAGTSLADVSLPKAVCVYTDGSTHEKRVHWDEAALSAVDTSKVGSWEIPGEILQKRWGFPLDIHFRPDAARDFDGMSDPCVTEYRGKYYLSSTGSQDIQLRIADTIEGTFDAMPTIIRRLPLGTKYHYIGTWAAELHVIEGVLYMFTALCENADWTHVKACVLRCSGDPADPGAWSEPEICVKKDGSLLTENGISLDMTYIEDGGRHYVLWSDRKIHYGTEPLEAGTADIYIGTIDPKRPWVLTSDPCCLMRPTYGWDRFETEVDEGPYLLRRGDDLFVTVSGSSTSMGDLYDVGLLWAKSGTDLLNTENWTLIGYPLLTKESVPGEYGPGHNNFVKDPETGDDIMVYHAVPHDENDRTLLRKPGLRRVHWAATGLPYLEMTAERDLPEKAKNITMKLVIQ